MKLSELVKGVIMRLRKLILATVASFCLLAAPAFAGEAIVSGGQLTIKPDQPNGSNFTLTVVGPHGFYADGKSLKSVPTVKLTGERGISDGIYRWQLSGSTQQKIRNPKPDFFNGREEKRPDFVNKSFDESGSFRVIDGVAQMPKNEEEKGSEGDKK
jgi:hypothetical protein